LTRDFLRKIRGEKYKTTASEKIFPGNFENALQPVTQ